MNYLEYTKLIESKGIELFDHEYRISYHNIINRRISSEQTGGGSIYKTLKSKDSDNLLNIVKISMSDTQRLISLLS